MKGEGKSQLLLQNLEKRKVAKINSVLRFELISMLKVYYINPLDIFRPANYSKIFQVTVFVLREEIPSNELAEVTKYTDQVWTR